MQRLNQKKINTVALKNPANQLKAIFVERMDTAVKTMEIGGINIDKLPNAAMQLIGFAEKNQTKTLLFYGEMGAGKTTLIKAICAVLGVKDVVSSPTFSIVNEYRYPAGIIYHFDFYRLKNQLEALDLGLEEYLDSGNYCLIEWPEKIPGLLPQHYARILMELEPDGQRKLTIAKI